MENIYDRYEDYLAWKRSIQKDGPVHHSMHSKSEELVFDMWSSLASRDAFEQWDRDIKIEAMREMWRILLNWKIAE